MFYVQLRAMIDENTPADREPLVYLAEGGKTSIYDAEYFDTKQEAEQAFLTSDLVYPFFLAWAINLSAGLLLLISIS